MKWDGPPVSRQTSDPEIKAWQTTVTFTAPPGSSDRTEISSERHNEPGPTQGMGQQIRRRPRRQHPIARNRPVGIHAHAETGRRRHQRHRRLRRPDPAAASAARAGHASSSPRPATARRSWSAPRPILNLYADAAKAHGYTQIPSPSKRPRSRSTSIPHKAIGISSTSRPTAPTTPSAPLPSSAATTTKPPAAAEHNGRSRTRNRLKSRLDTLRRRRPSSRRSTPCSTAPADRVDTADAPAASTHDTRLAKTTAQRPRPAAATDRPRPQPQPRTADLQSNRRRPIATSRRILAAIDREPTTLLARHPRRRPRTPPTSPPAPPTDMAITRRFQARTTVSPPFTASSSPARPPCRKQKIEILSQTPNADGTVTVVFCGQGLGKNAVPTPPPCLSTIANGQITIQPSSKPMTTPYGIAKNKATYGYNGWHAEMVYCLPQPKSPPSSPATTSTSTPPARKWPSWRSSTSPGWTATSSPPTPASRSPAASPSALPIVYLDVPWPDNITQPDYASGTTLKLHATYGGQLQPLAPRSIKPASWPVPAPTPSNQHLRRPQ